jgi:hypothetical protein
MHSRQCGFCWPAKSARSRYRYPDGFVLAGADALQGRIERAEEKVSPELAEGHAQRAHADQGECVLRRTREEGAMHKFGIIAAFVTVVFLSGDAWAASQLSPSSAKQFCGSHWGNLSGGGCTKCTRKNCYFVGCKGGGKCDVVTVPTGKARTVTGGTEGKRPATGVAQPRGGTRPQVGVRPEKVSGGVSRNDAGIRASGGTRSGGGGKR